MISVPQFRQNFGYIYQGQPVLPASWQSGFNTISSVGQFFGGFMCSYCADRFGRRAALLVGIILVAAGIFGEVFATANGAFLVGKMILGFGLGFYLTVGPMYCSEVGTLFLAFTMSTNQHRCLLSDSVVSPRLGSTSALSLGNCSPTLPSQVSAPGLISGHMLDHFQSNGSLSVSPIISHWQSYEVLTGQSFLHAASHSHQNRHGILCARTDSRMRKIL